MAQKSPPAGSDRTTAPDEAEGTVDPGCTYVLDETSITKTMSIEELAEMALRNAEERDSDASGKPQTDDAFDWDELG